MLKNIFVKIQRTARKVAIFRQALFCILLISLILSISDKVSAMNTISLKNGMQMIFEKRPGSGVVAAQVWVKVGSKYETEKEAGITHFIEHLIFKGTEKLKGNAFASRVEALGGSVNAFTSYDNTVYHITIPKQTFEEGLGLLLESVKNPLFPEAEIEKERKVVLEEIKMGEDDTQRKLFKELFSVAYQGQPYGRPVIGFEETVKAMTRPAIVKYYKSHYTPENMTVVVVGDFDEETVKKSVEKAFGGMKKGLAKKLPASSTKKGSGAERIIEKDVKEEYAALAYPIPTVNHKDIPALEVLGTILGEGESSRLVETLKREKSLVTGISTYVFNPKEEGLFVIFATFNKKEHKDILAGIDEEVSGIVKRSPTEWEIEKAKNIIEASYIYSAETVQGKARQVGDFVTLTGDSHFLEKFLKAVSAVTADDVKRVAQTYLIGKARSVVYVTPKAAQKKEKNPYTLELPNGLKCVVNKNKASQSVAFRVGFIGGLKEEPAGKNGLFNLMSRMLLKGTKKKDAPAIAREIDFLAGDISPYNGRNLFGLGGKFLSKDLGKALTLTQELLTQTEMKDDELTKVRIEVLSDIRQRQDDPVSMAFLKFNEALYKGHPYGKDTMGKEEDVSAITIDDVKEAYKRYVTPSHAVIAISGDVDEKEIFRMVKEQFSSWKGSAQNLTTVRLEGKAQKIAVPMDIMQTHMIFGFPGPGLIDEDRFASEVLDAALSGMGGRIHKVLREENPYAYSVTYFNQPAYEVSGMGIYIGTDKRYMKDVERIAKAELESIAQKGLTEKEVEDGKRYLIGNHFIQMQSNAAIASSMCFDVMYGMEPGLFKVYPSLIEKVTRDDINKVAKKYLQLDKMTEFSLGKVE